MIQADVDQSLIPEDQTLGLLALSPDEEVRFPTTTAKGRSREQASRLTQSKSVYKSLYIKKSFVRIFNPVFRRQHLYYISLY